MRKAFFVWQHSSKGYSPAIYYDEVPKSIEKGLGPKIAAKHELEARWMRDVESGECLDEVQVSFNTLAQYFPAPIDTIEPKVKLDAADA